MLIAFSHQTSLVLLFLVVCIELDVEALLVLAQQLARDDEATGDSELVISVDILGS